MNRLTTALFAALEALIVVAIGVGFALVPLSLLWAISYGMSMDWLVFWRASADIWLLGHGVDLRVTLPLETSVSLGLPDAGTPFSLTVAALGFALFTAVMAWRIGRRAAVAEAPRLTIAVAVVTMLALGALIGLGAQHPIVQSALWQAVLFPAGIFTVGALLGALSFDPTVLGVPPILRRLDQRMRLLLARAISGGVAAAASIVAVAAGLVAVLIAVNYGTIVGLYETMQAGPLGGLALTLAQLSFLPVFIVWAASWLIGPGFAIGTGSSVSPALTQLGALPGVPLFGVLPHDPSPVGFAVVLVPIVLGIGVGVLTRRGLKFVPDARELGLLGAAIGAVGGVILGLLAWCAAGAIGPGRFTDAGPNPVLVGSIAALEIAVGAAIGLFALRERWAGRGAEKNVHSAG